MNHHSHSKRIGTLLVTITMAGLIGLPEPLALAASASAQDTQGTSVTSEIQNSVASDTSAADPSVTDLSLATTETPDTSVTDPSAPTTGEEPADPADPQEPQDPKGDPEEVQDPVYDPITYEVPFLVTIDNEGTLEQGDVTAKLMEGDTCLGEHSSTAEGTLHLPALTFDKPGTYTYTLQLSHKERPGLSLTKDSYAITIEVSAQNDELKVISLTCDEKPANTITIECHWQEPAGTWSLDAAGWHYRTYNHQLVKNTSRVIEGKTYRFDGSGTMVTGWYKDGTVWRYFGGVGGPHDGAMRTHCWLLQGHWYWLGDDGVMATGWHTIDGRHYWFDGSGAMASNGWKFIHSRWYFLNFSGDAASGWRWDNYYGAWYYLDPAEKCAMATGWRKVVNTWYFMDGSGAMHANGWMRLGSTWYFLYPSGAMATGWHWIGNAWYYLGDSDDGAMKTGWFQDGGTYWYYCDGSGAMVANRWIGPWWVNGSGAWDPSLPASGKTGWQNPAGYYQVSCYGVRFPGAYNGYYVTPPRISANATREQCIQAFLAQARNYLGTPYRWNYSDAPGVGVDCIGLVYQCAYATGMDLGEFNPYNHWITGPYGWHSHDANNFWNSGKIQRLPMEARQPGDLIFWPGHVAIYIGNDQVIEAVPGRVRQASMRASGTNYRGVGRLYI